MGLTHEPLSRHIPTTLMYFHNVSCLFTHSAERWSFYNIQVLVDGRDDWITLPDESFSPMTPFGHRSRLDRMIGQFSINPKHLGDRQKTELSQWVKARYEELHPADGTVKAVRYTYISFPVGEELAAERGPWVKRTPEEFAPGRLGTFATVRFKEGVRAR